jgi:hypothetical protein
MLRTPTKALHGHGRVEAEAAGYGAKLFLSFVLIATCTYTNTEKRLSDNFFNEKWLVSSENLNPLNNFW